MGLFERDDSKKEVRIDAPKRQSSSKLKREAENKLSDKSSGSRHKTQNSKERTNQDIYEQNEEIIRLLKKIVDDEQQEPKNNSTESVTGGMDQLL